jgi:hypothetical protein
MLDKSNLLGERKNIMDVNVNRLRLTAGTEQEFTRMIAIIDYENTKQILESVNSAILAGVKINDIISSLNNMIEVERNKPLQKLSDLFNDNNKLL